jgi:hypothetical protein
MTRSKGRTGGPYRRMRKRVLAASQVCAACGEAIDMSLPWPDPLSPSVDHIIPISQLPPDSPLLTAVSNGRPMHLGCNSRRGDGTRDTPPRYIHPTSRNWYA